MSHAVFAGLEHLLVLGHPQQLVQHPQPRLVLERLSLLTHRFGCHSVIAHRLVVEIEIGFGLGQLAAVLARSSDQNSDQNFAQTFGYRLIAPAFVDLADFDLAGPADWTVYLDFAKYRCQRIGRL